MVTYFGKLMEKLPWQLNNPTYSNIWKHIINTLTHQQHHYMPPPFATPRLNLTTPGLPNFQPTDSQKTAAGMVLTEKRPLLLVEGPPGTGKTILISILTYHILTNNPAANILLCTQSNKAADHLGNLLAQISTAAPDAPYKPIRIYAPQRETLNTPIPTISLHQAAINHGNYTVLPAQLTTMHQLQQELLAFAKQPYQRQMPTAIDKAVQVKKLHQEIQAAYLEMTHPNLWILTCAMCTSEFLNGIPFTHVIIDEIGQSTHWELLMACLRLHTHKAKQVILIGDRHQLPPTIIMGGQAGQLAAECPAAMLERRGVTLNYQLDICFHMHSRMLSYPSEAFYQGRIRSGIADTDRQLLISRFPLPNKEWPIVFIAHHVPEGTPIGFSRRNKQEVHYTTQLLSILRQLQIDLKQVAVITPYHAQYTALQEKCYELDLPVPPENVATVDSFQGDEKDIVILSCVHSAPTSKRLGPDAATSSKVGFLDDYRRMNVALTRAKRGLFIIGNPATLATCRIWYDLLRSYQPFALIQASFLESIQAYHLNQPPTQCYSSTDAHLQAIAPGLSI